MELAVALATFLISISLPLTHWKFPRWLPRMLFLAGSAVLFWIAARWVWINWPNLSLRSLLLGVSDSPIFEEYLIIVNLLLLSLLFLVVFFARPTIRRIAQIEEAVERYVLPRHLSIEEQNKISEYLSERKPHTITMRYSSESEEVNLYRGDFEAALTSGGWTVRLEPERDLAEGVSLAILAPPTFHGSATEDNPEYLISEALSQIGLEIVEVRQTTTNDQPYTITMCIGPRRTGDSDKRAYLDGVAWLKRMKAGRRWRA